MLALSASRAAMVTVAPTSIEFADVEAMTCYLVALSVQNTSRYSVRFRLTRPASRHFRVLLDQQDLALVANPTRTLSPGLAIKFDVSFLLEALPETSDDDLHDKLLILVENSAPIEIPLVARRPSPALRFDSLIDLGMVVLSHRTAKYVNIANVGAREAHFLIETEAGLPLTITPKAGVIPAQCEAKLKVDFTARDLGSFRSIATIRITEGRKHALLDISATVVEHTMELVFPSSDGLVHEPVKMLPFGMLYTGESRQIDTVLRNNGPQPVGFQTGISLTGRPFRAGDEIASPEDDGGDYEEKKKELTAMPAEGYIPPYGHVLLSFVYKPSMLLSQRMRRPSLVTENNPLEAQGRPLRAFASVECAELNQNITIEISGTAVTPHVSISPESFDFGECAAGARVDMLLSIKNQATLPVVFAIAKLAHFSVQPCRGRLDVLQSQSLVVSFVPSQLGRFHNALDLSIQNGSIHIPIPVHGAATSVGPKKKTLVGGPDALPQDFRPKFNFVTHDDVKLQKAQPTKSFQRVPPYQVAAKEGTAAVDEFEFQGTNNTHLTYCVNELADRAHHRDAYNQLLTQFRHDRFAKSVPAPSNQNAADLGMAPQGGLQGPDMKLPKATEPLWMQSEQNSRRGVAAANPAFDENKLIKRKFKAAPVTQAEVKDCATTLTSEQLKLIVAGPKTIHFGLICVHSVSKKSFSVTNDLPHNILVTLHFNNDHEELKQTSPMSQVIPAGATAGFDLTFFSRAEQVFQKYVQYSVNGQHSFKLLIVAEVVPICVELSTPVLEFAFDASDLSPTISQTVQVKNPGNSEAHYRWVPEAADQCAFEVTPVAGAIAAGGTASVRVTFAPRIGVPNQATLCVLVDGGKTNQIHCVGHLPEPKCLIKDKKIDFGATTAGIPKEKRLLLLNLNAMAPTVFYAEIEPTTSGVSIKPAEACLLPSDTTELLLGLDVRRPLVLENVNLVVRIRGGRTIRIPISADVVVPRVEFESPLESFAFGGLTLGVHATRALKLANRSLVPAHLELLFEKTPEFNVVMPQALNPSIDDVQSVFGPLDPLADVTPTRNWRLVLPPEASVALELSFLPTVIASHAFPFPMQFEGLLARHDPFDRIVTATGLKPRLLFSVTTLDFEKRVVATDNARKIPYSVSLVLTNDDPNTIKWHMDLANLMRSSPSVFHIAPSSGELAAGDKCTVRASFLPLEAEAYTAEIPVLLDDLPYLTLSLVGHGIHPHLSFSVPRVDLPPVPLGVASSTSFFVTSTGYDNLDLSYRLPIDLNRVPITVSFPDGKAIGIANPRIQVDVSFCSLKSIAFNAKLEFFDAEGHEFDLALSGFSRRASRRVRFYTDVEARHPIYFLEKTQLKLLAKRTAAAAMPLKEPAKRQVTPAVSKKRGVKGATAAVNDTGPAPGGYVDVSGKLYHAPALHELRPEEITLLVKWLNMNILKTPIVSFPQDIVAAAGRPIYEMLDVVCGKSVPGRLKSVSGLKKEQMQQLMGQYTELLRFLKSYGALLNDLRPEQLLDMDMYLRWMEDDSATLAAHSSANRRATLEKDFGRVSVHVWLKIVYQIIKCFVLFRVSMKSFQNLPGIEAATALKPLAVMVHSNVYSESEMVLIQWLLHHAKRAATVSEPRLIVDIETDLRDCVVLSYVLISHVPSLAAEAGPLYGFHRNPMTPEHVLENASSLRNALSLLGLDYGLAPELLCSLSLPSTILLVLHLYQNVPQFIPKTTIEFKGILGQTITKSIELKNPSKKTIVYDVFLEGQVREFSIYAHTLTLEPEKSATFAVDFKPKFTRTVTARLTFRSVRDGPSCAATMVFVLESNIYSRKPVRVYQFETTLYERKLEEISIENQFPVNGVYKLSVLQQAPTRHDASASTLLSKIGSDDGCMDAQLPFFLPEVTTDTIAIRKDASTSIKVEFIPLQPGTYKCQLLFLDENVGEFMYEVQCTAHLPPVLETLEFTCENKPHLLKELTVPVKNPLLTKALACIIDRFQGILKAKLRESLKKCEDAHHTNFHIEVNSPYYVLAASDIVLKPASNSALESEKRATNANAAPAQAKLSTPRNSAGTLAHPSLNSVAFDFQPRGAGLYACKLLLRSTANCGSDIRVYEVLAKVNDAGVKTTLEFSAPARQTITQEIPIINPTDEAWTLRATLSGTQGVFSGASTLVVPAGKTANYALVFKPQWLVTETGSLVLTNPKTEQVFEFLLGGVGEEPLAVQHIVLSCVARQSVAHEFEVQTYRYDPAGATSFSVESDLPYVGGPPTITVDGPNSTALYKLLFSPLLGGSYFGSITFTNSRTGEYSWYTIEASVAAPEPEATLEMHASVRSAVGMEISLQNPLSHAVTFAIRLLGAGLYGPSEFRLDAEETGIYQLLYCPLVAGSTVGSIGFTNEDVGEFSYVLALHATPAPPTQLADMSCAVGDVCSQPIAIVNPMDSTFSLDVHLSNTRNYRIRDTDIVVKPFSTYTAVLDYTPSSLSEFECADITFRNPDVGAWEYKVQGKGKPPSLMKTTLVHATVGEAASSLFAFRNPFPDALNVEVTMVQLDPTGDENVSSPLATKSDKVPSTSTSVASANPSRQRHRPPAPARAPVFDILLKKPHVLLEGFGTLQVPISFLPKYVSEAGAHIIIKGDTELEWVYPIRGIAAAPVHPKAYSFVCRARESVEKTLSLELLALEKVSPDERFTVEWDIPEPHARVVERTLKVTPVVDRITNVTDPLVYLVRFDPLKPLRLAVGLIVKKRSGGMWRFDVHLDASDPVVDDVLTIESALNQTSSVAFKLTNQFREPAPFQAEFTAGSSQAFTVYPVEGILAPYGTEGTSFSIAFTPTGYGKMCSGQLVILTDEMQWTFNVKGTHPEYKAPTGEAKIFVPAKSTLSSAQKTSPPNARRKLFKSSRKS
ncbi:hypothetical protein SPRG_02218 [Saprolegnia parasitica CBS 223.65]|uniref:Calponin-homology (CH) domain-containing protein n=1 Tax=Saprolegnia parasitica (strain CBS 223.65) TaxID=695850 RepID=A0A067D3T9_SAPPC|nr:hypothetical protein SPRG_02218 [Saprolegnia parasitica CBS 223.65]KDO33411.1 hypothetical protein SPRG_02218 [Saprolegnia parasitica CBS 223.65]|eukprot:XP_012196159.1 hypothetical protein SPRG_02218 [Saprolegnia parasitica CBS 223.65]